MDEIFYYSFRCGFVRTPHKEWTLHDLKIPAHDPKEAVITFLWHRNYMERKKNPWMRKGSEFILPNPEYIYQTVRQIIEYKIARKSGYFLVQYKKTRLITIYEVMMMFK